MPILKIVVTLFLIWRVLRYLHRRGSAAKAQAVLTGRRRWALQFAHPYVEANGVTGFDLVVATLGDEGRAASRAALLHQMALRIDASDDDVRAHLARVFETRWFRADLHALGADDAPHAALAFACARMAFLARLAMVLGWAEPDVAWRVLLLNAQRAQDCFSGWDDFGRAFLAGRRQWVAGFRADPLGVSFDEAALQRWLAPGSGAWHGAGWPAEPSFDPRVVADPGTDPDRAVGAGSRQAG